MTNTTLVSQWLYRPQNVSLRKALFQVHLWAGIALGLYILLISISGSAIVFRNEISKAYSAPPKIVPISGPKLTHDELKQAVERAYPQYSVSHTWEAKAQRSHRSVAASRRRHENAALRSLHRKDLGDRCPSSFARLPGPSTCISNLLAAKPAAKLWHRRDLHHGTGAYRRRALVAGNREVAREPDSPSRSELEKAELEFAQRHRYLDAGLRAGRGVTGIFVVFPAPFERAVNLVLPLEFYSLPDARLRPGRHPLPRRMEPSQGAVRCLPCVERPAIKSFAGSITCTSAILRDQA